ncbi:MAG: hypothetical protein R3A45_02840 [Bdellovibrionota bacterium]
MKKSLVIAFALLASNASFAADKYVVNTTDTTIAWTGSKSLVDSKHVGTIDVKEGYLEFTKGDLTGGQFVVDMRPPSKTAMSRMRNTIKSLSDI